MSTHGRRTVLSVFLMLSTGLLLASADTKIVGARCDPGQEGYWGLWCVVTSECDGPVEMRSDRCVEGQTTPTPRIVCCSQSGSPPPDDVTTTKKNSTMMTTPTTTMTTTTTTILMSASEALKVAKKKCVEYAQYVYEEVASQSLLNDEEVYTESRCQMVGQPLVSGGEPADEGEFPHMVALGYQTDNSVDGVVAWRCGGSLISPLYVLTAAHCIYDRRTGYVRWALLGSTVLTNKNAQKIEVAERLKHPAYSSMSNYDDIALLKLKSAPNLSPELRPACVGIKTHEQDPALGKFGTAYDITGWGLNVTGGNGLEQLMKVDLYQVPMKTCDTIFEFLLGSRKLSTGIHRDSMLCIGNKEVGKDSCQGDSGGPAQTRLSGDDFYCMYDIAGVTSFGENTCGGSDFKASIYTKVEHYLPWIVSVVWSD